MENENPNVAYKAVYQNFLDQHGTKKATFVNVDVPKPHFPPKSYNSPFKVPKRRGKLTKMSNIFCIIAPSSSKVQFKRLLPLFKVQEGDYKPIEPPVSMSFAPHTLSKETECLSEVFEEEDSELLSEPVPYLNDYSYFEDNWVMTKYIRSKKLLLHSTCKRRLSEVASAVFSDISSDKTNLEVLARRLSELSPFDTYTNQLIKDIVILCFPELKNEYPLNNYRAMNSKVPIAVHPMNDLETLDTLERNLRQAEPLIGYMVVWFMRNFRLKHCQLTLLRVEDMGKHNTLEIDYHIPGSVKLQHKCLTADQRSALNFITHKSKTVTDIRVTKGGENLTGDFFFTQNASFEKIFNPEYQIGRAMGYKLGKYEFSTILEDYF